MLYLFIFCAYCLFVCLLSRKKKILFVHLVLSASQIFVQLEFIYLFFCMLMWFYIFHSLEYNIFTFLVAQCGCWCDFLYGVNYFIWMYFLLICLYSLFNIGCYGSIANEIGDEKGFFNHYTHEDDGTYYKHDVVHRGFLNC